MSLNQHLADKIAGKLQETKPKVEVTPKAQEKIKQEEIKIEEPILFDSQSELPHPKDEQYVLEVQNTVFDFTSDNVEKKKENRIIGWFKRTFYAY